MAVNILSWPRPYDANPYLGRLRDALEAREVRVRTDRYLAALALRPRRAQWAHLHWPEWMLRDRSQPRAWARALWFFALIDSLRARGVRVAWTAHNLIGHDEPHPALAERFRRMWLARCDLVHGHFEGAEQSVRDLGFRGRFVCAGHPHAGDDYAPSMGRAQARESLGLRPEQRALLCFGSIERYKGFDRVAQALSTIDDPRLRLIVSGRGSDAAQLRALRALAERDGRIEIREGFLSRTDTANLVLAADALVLGYRAFFTSGTAMLALTMGTPVLGPPVHHLGAMASERFFSAMATPDALAEALAREGVFAPESRERARAWAAQFTYDGLARTLARAFAEREER